MRRSSSGFYISVSGIATFKKSEALRDVLKRVPLDRLLVETDAPYLAPVPHRGKTNEPAFVVHTAAMLAELKGCQRTNWHAPPPTISSASSPAPPGPPMQNNYSRGPADDAEHEENRCHSRASGNPAPASARNGASAFVYPLKHHDTGFPLARE